MMSKSPQAGFTLIELMITIIVAAVLITLAMSSYSGFRERSIVRGAADQMVAFWANARFEAVKRNALMKVTFLRSGSTMCMGASTTTNPTDTATCDCFTSGACAVAAFPADQSEWRGAQWTADPGFGAGTGVVVVDPNRGVLTDAAATGGVTMRSPSSTEQYQLRFVLDSLGRGFVCQPSAAPMKLAEYNDRPC